jgi:predicted phosphodiesterase
MTIKPNRRYLVVPDLQIPLHNVAAVKSLIKMAKHEKFDFVLNCGDEMDMGSQSRWAKGTKLEFAETLDEERSLAQDILYDLGTTDIIRSNHTDRLYTTLLKGAPSLIGLPELAYDKFMDFASLGIKYHRKAYEFERGFHLAHGDEGNMSKHAGITAINLSKKWQSSVVCGHSHRQGAVRHTTGLNGRYSTIWGIEAGHLMDMRQAGYLKYNSADWNMGFVVMSFGKKGHQVELIPVNQDGSFTYNRRTYGA